MHQGLQISRAVTFDLLLIKYSSISGLKSNGRQRMLACSNDGVLVLQENASSGPSRTHNK